MKTVPSCLYPGGHELNIKLVGNNEKKKKHSCVVVPYCYLFLLSVFILWFSYYVSDIFCKF